jgi:two-component system, chemotaxis family, chemotaxis protein CheY
MIKKILIVDDSPIARKILKSCIPTDYAYELHEAVNGKDGLEKYNELNPDITFLDLTMPIMTGDECLREIKKSDEKAVVIIITADIQTKSIMNVMDLGALAVLKKPPSKESIQKAFLMARETLANLR